MSWNHKAHYRVDKSPPMNIIFSQLNSVHIIPSPRAIGLFRNEF